MRILGIDPGLAIMGYGIIDKDGGSISLVKYGTIQTSPDTPFPLRLRSIDMQLRDIIEEFKPDEIAFEELFFQKNVSTAFVVGAARGVAISVCASYLKEQIFEYTPLQIKQAIVGYGRADKKQVQQMVKLMLKLDDIPRPDDAADAVALAITHATTGRYSSMYLMK